MEGIANLVGQGLYMAVAAVVGLALARVLRVDNTLGCLVAGVFAGMLLPILDFETGLRVENMQQLVFFVILPVLIFESAWQIEPAVLKRWLGPILLLATMGVVICAAIIALLTYFGINQPTGYPWLAALITGAILAATDSTAVVTKLRQSEASKDLLTLVEGESLLNDAAAIALFMLVLGLASYSVMEGSAGAGGSGPGVGAVATYFAVTLFGGLVVGALCGLIAAIVALFLRAAGAALVTLVLAAFGSFYLAEHVVHVSGIIAVTVCAIVTRTCLREQRETYLAHAEPTWEWLGLLFSALIFVTMGLLITFDMFAQQWLAMLIAIAAAIGARGLAISMVAPLAHFTGRPIPKSWRLILSWGGLRGVIAAALALSLPTTLPYWWTVQSIVFGVVLFSLLVQGTSSRWVINRLPDQQD